MRMLGHHTSVPLRKVAQVTFAYEATISKYVHVLVHDHLEFKSIP